MRYLSVCSGIEAATCAWHRLGWSPAGFSEIEPFPRAVLEQRLDAVAVDWDHRYDPAINYTPLFGDFTQIQEHHVGPVDLLVGGTPCQSFSVAGKRLGLDDPRGNLAIEFLALARRLRARWLVWENVPGVLSSWSGEPPSAPEDAGAGWEAEYDETGDLHAFLQLFSECGYRGGYRVLDAQFIRVDGFEHAVPQRRRRVFAVGHLGNDSRALPVLFEPECLSGSPQPRRSAGQGFARDVAPSLTGSSVGARRIGDGRGQDPVIAERVAFGGNDTRGPIDVSPARLAKAGTHFDFESEAFITERGAFAMSDYSTGAFRETEISDTVGTGTDASRTAPLIVQEVSAPLRAGGNKAGWHNDLDQGAFVPEASQTLRARDGAREVDSDATDTLLPVPIAFKASHFTRGKGGAPSDVAHPLTADADADADADMGDQDNLILGKAFTVSQNSNGFAWEGDVAAAVQAHQPNPEANTFSGVTDQWRVRRLTPRECERLQGFPDDWTLIKYGDRLAVDDERLAYLRRTYPDITREEAEELAADAPRYKAIGNSKSLNAILWIGTRIDLVERLVGEAA